MYAAKKVNPGIEHGQVNYGIDSRKYLLCEELLQQEHTYILDQRNNNMKSGISFIF